MREGIRDFDWRRWGAVAFVCAAVLGFGIAVAIAIWFSAREQQQTEDIAEANKRRIEEAFVANFILCRSTGRTIDQCQKISEGILIALQPSPQEINEVRSRLIKTAEAQVQKLFVGGRSITAEGIRGTAGPAGPIGLAGRRGPRGLRGIPGTAARRGAKGERGPQGPRGLPGGPKGDKGETGAQGPRGETGARGQTGPRGIQGPAGPRGEQGARGAQGERGAAGATGATGATGPTGPQGPIGPPGVPQPPLPCNWTFVTINSPGGQVTLWGCRRG